MSGQYMRKLMEALESGTTEEMGSFTLPISREQFEIRNVKGGNPIYRWVVSKENPKEKLCKLVKHFNKVSPYKDGNYVYYCSLVDGCKYNGYFHPPGLHYENEEDAINAYIDAINKNKGKKVPVCNMPISDRTYGYQGDSGGR
jgi:hypothetical protein